MDNFNFFKNLHLTEDGHSSILKRILSTSGTHGYKDNFLRLFLEKIGVPYNVEKKWHVTGKKSGNRGMVDLIIYNDDLSTIAVIENKIKNAKEQPSQLYRYWRNEIFEPLLKSGMYPKDYLISKEVNENKEITDHYKVIYLTADGRKKIGKESMKRPESKDGKYDGFPEIFNFNVTEISYKKDIKNWLIDCKKVVSRDESLRLYLILEQYIEWIDSLE